MNTLQEELLNMISELEGDVSNKKLWDPKRLRRIINRLTSFSECAQCQDYLHQLAEDVRDIWNRRAHLDKEAFTQHRRIVKEIVGHLHKEHGMVDETYYTGIYMSLGMSLGLTFGLTLLDNLALGMSMGMCIGLCIGAAMDADIKKKDKII